MKSHYETFCGTRGLGAPHHDGPRVTPWERHCARSLIHMESTQLNKKEHAACAGASSSGVVASSKGSKVPIIGDLSSTLPACSLTRHSVRAAVRATTAVRARERAAAPGVAARACIGG